jgi:hypothetical protein
MIDFVMPDWFYDQYVKSKNEDMKSILPYPLWKKKPKWAMNTTIPDICPYQKVKYKTFGACPSTKNWMNKTVVIPWPCDFQIGMNEEKDELAWFLDGGVLSVQNHTREQLPDWEERGNLKFVLPYVHRTKSGPLLVTGPHLHKDLSKLPYEIMLGLTDTINTPLQCNINTMWRKMGEEEAFFAFAGDPLCYFTFPSVRGKVRVRHVRSDHNNDFMTYPSKLRQKFVLS